jgi:hypothetical protein
VRRGKRRDETRKEKREETAKGRQGAEQDEKKSRRKE